MTRFYSTKVSILYLGNICKNQKKLDMPDSSQIGNLEKKKKNRDFFGSQKKTTVFCLSSFMEVPLQIIYLMNGSYQRGARVYHLKRDVKCVTTGGQEICFCFG